MTEYEAYLNIGENGVHAHVLNLPGCFARGSSFEEALENIPAAIRMHFALDGIQPPDQVRYRVKEAVYEGGGPFDPGSQSALFEIEKKALSKPEIEAVLELAAENRAKLLAIARDLPERVLDWTARPDHFSIRRILRHVGNAEEWYVSRLLPPESLPPEWENDSKMPLFDFLEMERRTALLCLQNLTEEQRSGEPVYPTHFTSNPGEAWTVRKVLRRLLEHEREHLSHVLEVLEDWRWYFLSRLAAERSWFLWQLRGFDEQMLEQLIVYEDWSPKDLLAHVGEWDQFHTERMDAIVAGNYERVADTREAGFYERENEKLHKKHGRETIEDVLKKAAGGRNAFLESFAMLADEVLFRAASLPEGQPIELSAYVQYRHLHDADHGQQLAALREGLSLENRAGSKAVLLAILDASMEEIVSLVELVSPDEPVTGEWNMRDVLGHLADWESVGVKVLREFLRGESGPFMTIDEDAVEAWNRDHAARRKDQVLEQALDDFQRNRGLLMAILKEMDPADLERKLKPPWGGEQSLYDFLLEWPGHDREHAAMIRLELELGYPERLLEH